MVPSFENTRHVTEALDDIKGIPGLGLAACSILAIFVVCFESPADDVLSVETISKKWRQRETALKNVALDWKDHIRVPPRPPLPRERREGTTAQGTNHLDYEEMSTLSFEARKWKLVNKGKVLSAEGKLIRQDETLVFDGTLLKSLMPPGAAKAYAGGVSNGSETRVPQLITLQPPFMLVRPLSTGLLDLTGFRVLDRREWMGDTKCVVLEKVEGDFTATTLHVAPTMDLALMRYSLVENGNLRRKIDFTYKPGNGPTWIPTGWRIIQGHPQRITQTVDATLSRFVSDVAFHSNEFTMEFPEGTVVTTFTNSSGGVTEHFVRRWNWFLTAALVLLVMSLLLLLRRRPKLITALFPGRKKDA